LKILACDTSIGFGSVCLLKDGKIISSINTSERHKQAEQLLLNIEQVLKEAEYDYKDLDFLAVTTGPGSFTGVRVGISAIKGIALASGLNVIGVTTLQSMAKNNTITVLKAGRGQVYYQKFDENSAPITEIELIDVDKIPNKSCVIGNIEMENIIYKEPSAIDVANYAFKNIQLAIKGENIKPTYIRPPDAVPCKKNTA